MEKIKQYYEISIIKPDFHKLYHPFYKPSIKRIELNNLEMLLHYSNEFKTYISDSKSEKIKGSNESNLLIVLI